MNAKTALVGFNQPHLPDRSGGLQFIQGARPLGPPQATDAFGNGTTGNQNDFLAHGGNLGNLLGPQGQTGMVETTTIVSHQTAADLDHQSVRKRNHRSTHAMT